MRVVTQQGDTVDALCFRHLGRTEGVIEIVLEQNPGLADYGAVLPYGLQVDLPDTPPQPTTTATTLRLWD